MSNDHHGRRNCAAVRYGNGMRFANSKLTIASSSSWAG